MGAMKSYLMWLEEKGYMEFVDHPHGGDYMPTLTHPGEAEAMNEYLTHKDAKKENDNV